VGRISPLEILKPNFSPDFIELMRYGIITKRLIMRDAIAENWRAEINVLFDRYEESKDPKLLADVANYLMFVYMKETGGGGN